MIRNGVMPQMDTRGLWNYEARLGMYQRMQEENPAVFQDMAPDKAEMPQLDHGFAKRGDAIRRE